MRKLISLVGAAALVLSIVPATLAASPVESPKKANATIVGIAAGSPSFSILVAAVQKAGLVDALNGTDQYTVYAPTNAAFISTFDALLKADLTAADVIGFINAGGVDATFGDGALAKILLYHVETGRHFSNSVLPKRDGQMKTIDTLAGQSFWVNASGTITTTSGATSPQIIMPNINATNGVIHVVDAVLIPSL
jgi:uncharacterized surface protein with fasciclin (FAS1) repeats